MLDHPRPTNRASSSSSQYIGVKQPTDRESIELAPSSLTTQLRQTSQDWHAFHDCHNVVSMVVYSQVQIRID